jgi:hypothetical protein
MTTGEQADLLVSDRDPAALAVEENETRLVVTLSPPAAGKARLLARKLNIRVPEAIRRGLSLLQLVASLQEGEYLAVRRANGELERVLIAE